MDIYEINYLLDSIAEKSTNLLTNIYQLSCNIENRTSNDLTSVYQSLLDKTILLVRQIADDVHSAICQLEHDDPTLANLLNRNICNTSEIFLTNTKTEIIIHLPFMSHKCTRQSTWYIPFLRKLISLNSKNLPVFKKINVRFLHVYPIGTNEQHTKDNDNYEVKQIIDLIAAALAINDYGANCSLVMETSITDCLLPGSYVIVTEMMDDYISTSAIIEMIRQNISSEGLI